MKSWQLSQEIKKKKPFVETLELLAARRAVGFSLQVGFLNSTFEGDSESIIRSLNDDGMVNSFQSYSFSHVIR